MRALVDLVVRNRKRSAIIAAALIASVGAGVAASDKDKRARYDRGEIDEDGGTTSEHRIRRPIRRSTRSTDRT